MFQITRCNDLLDDGAGLASAATRCCDAVDAAKPDAFGARLMSRDEGSLGKTDNCREQRVLASGRRLRHERRLVGV